MVREPAERVRLDGGRHRLTPWHGELALRQQLVHSRHGRLATVRSVPGAHLHRLGEFGGWF